MTTIRERTYHMGFDKSLDPNGNLRGFRARDFIFDVGGTKYRSGTYKTTVYPTIFNLGEFAPVMLYMASPWLFVYPDMIQIVARRRESEDQISLEYFNRTFNYAIDIIYPGLGDIVYGIMGKSGYVMMPSVMPDVMFVIPKMMNIPQWTLWGWLREFFR